MVINQSSAYVTYSRPEDAVAAIKSLNESTGKSGQRSSAASTASNGQQQPLRASLGTTKYCTHWLRSQSCPKQPDCMYLHEMAEPEASFTKEEMQLGKHTEYEKRLIQHYLDLLAKEKAEKTNRKNAAKDHTDSNTTTTTATTGDKVQSKTITINNKTKQRHHKNNNNSHNHHNNTTAHNNHTNGSAGSNGFNGETNGFGDEYSNDSMANGESGDSNAGTAQSSSSPVTQGWGTPTTQTTAGRAMVSSNNSSANSESNSLSSTPNQTSGAAQPSPQEALVHQLQHGVRLGQTQRILSQTYQKSAGGGGGGASDLFNSIDDNAVDAQIMQTMATKTVDMDGDDSNDDITANDDDDDDGDDDDGLDFDPISISTRGLQDLLKDSSIMMTTGMGANSGAGVIGHRQQPNHVFNNQLNSDHMYMSSASHNLPIGPKPPQNSMQMPIQQMMANKSVADYQNSLLANNRHHMMNAFNNQQMSGSLSQQQQQQQHLTQHHIHSQQQQQPPPLWQTQQQNSLRQLLPNVNIAFRQQPNGAPGMDTNGGPNALMNGFAGNLNTNNSSQQMIPNIRQQQQQSIAHQMGGQSMISGHPVWSVSHDG
ncbi:unnamed protein product [Medioppia subpectinata]|uniref:C3H1-type domain-containing protein n=1 Tax=Medioppia subpectinata TaxID=1979941 RepID=A0A7R9KWC6_9ACAR|nr:unnamed protein product [Medioppia subpectinata]CAG2110950.1 unnamed protein product [Medioppia subpectinata]